MKITDNKTIQSIQKAFNEKFPNLKLNFYTQPHSFGEGSPNNEKLDKTKTIGEVRQVHTDGDIQIDAKLTVQELETLMAEKYGLNLQVYRRSGDLWLQTISTDNWTLETQNERGGVTS